MTLSQSIAAIAWDPQIRGVLSVVVMVALLMGSVYVLLATNLANRLGFLVAITGLFGWMTLLGITWWVYGQGWIGDAPSWEVEEINTGDLSEGIVEDARPLSPERVEEALEGNELFQEAAAAAAATAREAGEREPRVDEVLNDLPLDDFETIADDLKDELAGWRLLPESDPVRGEAQAAVDDSLQSPDYASFDSPNDYVVQYGMDIGGKPEPDRDNVLDVIGNRITNTLRFKNPPKYTLIMVQPGQFVDEDGDRVDHPEPGAPLPEVVPVDEVDGEPADAVSVVMVRDKGNLRLPAAMTTIVSGILFGLCCYLLHVRDKTLEANRAAPLPEVAGAAPALDKPNGSV